MSQSFNLLTTLNDTLAYFADTVAFLDTDKSITCAAVGTNLVAGSKIVISAAEDSGNNGTFTVVTAVAGKITVAEALTANVADAVVIREETDSGWIPVSFYSRIVGPLNATVATSFYTDWAPAASVTGMSTILVAMTANTPVSHAVETIAPFVRFRFRNNGTAAAVLTGALYAKELT